MAIEFRGVYLSPLSNLTLSAPDGCIIGIVGETNSGATQLLQAAGGFQRPESGEVIAPRSRRYLGIASAFDLSPVKVLAIDHAFAQVDAFERARALVALDRLRAGGTTILLGSHDKDLVRAFCEEAWWLEAGNLQRRGDAREVLEAYNERITAKFRAWGETQSTPIASAFRKGDGRAEIVRLEAIGSNGRASAVLRSGEDVTIRVEIRFHEAVPDPVIGIMIRTRIGLEVYGTNTELEKVPIGPRAAGDAMRIDFRFPCRLCPKEYTLTAASHDPDGSAHDWLDDAVAFEVADSRYTAGVANLAATVSVHRL